MAKLEETSDILVCNGILMPKISNRWRMLFSDVMDLEGNPVDGEFLDKLSMQIIATTRPVVHTKLLLTEEAVKIEKLLIAGSETQTLYKPKDYRYDPLTLTFEEDITGYASNILIAILKIQQRFQSNSFKITLDSLDGGQGVIDSWILKGCRIDKIWYSDYNYAISGPCKIYCSVTFDEADLVYMPHAPLEKETESVKTEKINKKQTKKK